MAFTMEISHYTQTDQNWSVETWFLWPWPWLKKKPTLKLWLMPTRLLDLNALHMIMLIWCWCYIWQFIPTSTIRKKGVHSRNYWETTELEHWTMKQEMEIDDDFALQSLQPWEKASHRFRIKKIWLKISGLIFSNILWSELLMSLQEMSVFGYLCWPN